MTELAHALRHLIKEKGPISVADYMAYCLGAPEHGYYRKKDPLGKEGDFITAPEISQVFGEVIGAWLIDQWIRLGKPNPFILLEAGPGRGTLMADILRIAKAVPEFLDSMQLYLLEQNQALRAKQAEKLSVYNPKWIEDISIPDLPLFFIANEFFDAMPLTQYVKTGNEWVERRIGLNKEDEFIFIPASGDILERNLTSETAIHQLAEHIKKHAGVALIIDYGYTRPQLGDTLQAVQSHQKVSIFHQPGLSDLTFHVDFGALEEAAGKQGVNLCPILSQGEFLKNFGIETRTQKLMEKATPQQAELLKSGTQRLIDPKQMGELFKVLIFGYDKRHAASQ